MAKNTAKSHITPTTATQFIAVHAGGLVAKVLGSALVALVEDTVPIVSGEWTPTYSSLTNISGVTHRYAAYQRIGDVVSFTVRVTATTSGAGPSRSMQLTVPVSPGTNFADAYQAAGPASTNATTSAAARLNSVSGSELLQIGFSDATASADIDVLVSGSYVMQA